MLICPGNRLQFVTLPIVSADELLSGLAVVFGWALAVGLVVGLAFFMPWTVRHWIACGLDALAELVKRGKHAD